MLHSTTQMNRIRLPSELDGRNISHLVDFLHEHLGQFRDPKEDIAEAFAYAMDRGGTVYTLEEGSKLLGVCLVLDTGMRKFVPKHFLVYIAVDARMRGKGLGKTIISAIQSDLSEPISLHVEHDNPAKRLYEKLGFTSKYAEMRWSGV